MSCKDPIVVPLILDGTLESMRNGDEAIFWLGEQAQKLFLGGRGIRLITTIAEITANTQVKFFAQYSYDGKTQINFARNLDGMTNGYTTIGTFEANYSDSPAEFGPLVRIGIQVKCTTALQAQVRLTAIAVIQFGNVTTDYGVLGSSVALSATAASVVLGSTFDGSNFDEGQVLVTYTGTPTGLIFSVWVSGDGGTTYGMAAAAASISVAPNSGEAVYIALPYLGAKMQVRYTLTSGASINCTGIKFIGRVN